MREEAGVKARRGVSVVVVVVVVFVVELPDGDGLVGPEAQNESLLLALHRLENRHQTQLAAKEGLDNRGLSVSVLACVKFCMCIFLIVFVPAGVCV